MEQCLLCCCVALEVEYVMPWNCCISRAHAYVCKHKSYVSDIFTPSVPQNPLETVKKLAKFLEKPATPELCAEIVEACSFKRQKESEESANESQAALKFYRKGWSKWPSSVLLLSLLSAECEM